jgi:hypothetical protein
VILIDEYSATLAAELVKREARARGQGAGEEGSKPAVLFVVSVAEAAV